MKCLFDLIMPIGLKVEIMIMAKSLLIRVTKDLGQESIPERPLPQSFSVGGERSCGRQGLTRQGLRLMIAMANVVSRQAVLCPPEKWKDVLISALFLVERRTRNRRCCHIGIIVYVLVDPSNSFMLTFGEI